MLGLVTTWVDQTVSNQSRYVATVGPLISDPQVQGWLADSITDTLLDQVDVDRLLEEVLEQSDPPLSTNQVDGLREFLRAEIVDLLNTAQTQDAWERVNAELQVRVIAALRGEQNQAVVIENDAIVLDTGFVLSEVQTLLVERGFSPVEEVSLSSSQDRRIVLVEGEQVSALAAGYRTLDRSTPLLLLTAVAVLATGILLNRHRWRSVMRAAASVAIGSIALATVILATRIAVLVALDASQFGVEAAVLDAVMRGLWLLVAGVGTAAALAWWVARAVIQREGSALSVQGVEALSTDARLSS
jgi:hypothetical protein